MPLTSAPVITYTGLKLEPFQYPELVKTQVVQLAPPSALTYYKRGTLFSQANSTFTGSTSDNKFLPYSNAAVTTGPETARCILPYDIVVNTDGTYWYGNWTTSPPPGPNGEFRQNIDMYFGGCFLSTDLYIGAGTAEDTATAPDATELGAAMTDLNASIVMYLSAAFTSFIFRF